VRLAVHPEARTEIRAAALWYEEHRPGLGDEFIEEITGTLSRIEETPLSYPTWPGTSRARAAIHRATVRRFPYLLAFEVQADSLLVLAVAHAKRRPLYWLTRVTPQPH